MGDPIYDGIISGEFQILEVGLWKRAQIFANVGTFTVPLSM